MKPANRLFVAIGLAIACVVPLCAILVAFLWDRGAIRLDPDGALVGAIEAALPPALVLIPVGLLVTGLALRLRSPLAWLALFVSGLPIVAAIWFVGAAWIGGLAGEPF